MTKTVLGATALALLLGVGVFSLDAALAQNGGEARGNDREMKKALDDKHLTPIRPIRRVGPEGWPAAKDPRPTNLPPETTGQSAKQEEKKDEPAKQDTAKQEPPKQEPANQDTAKQEVPKQQPAQQDTAKQDTAKQDTPQPDANRQQAQQPADNNKPQQATAPDAAPTRSDTAQNKEQNQKDDKGFASIRLGTDAKGVVAVNESQEKQISTVMRKQRIKTFDVSATVGAAAPAEVRLGAVSSDLVEILPQFRGYSFFATREEIAIVEPGSRKVVALIPVKVTAIASRDDDEREATRTETTRTETPAPRRKADKPREVARETVGRGFPTREQILAAPVDRGSGTVTRTYRSYQAEPQDDPDVVIIERRRPRVFGLW